MSQIATQLQIVNLNTIMRDAELKKFDHGESTVFLINTRENKMLDAQIKMFELKSKVIKTIGDFNYTNGKF